MIGGEGVQEALRLERGCALIWDCHPQPPPSERRGREGNRKGWGETQGGGLLSPGRGESAVWTPSEEVPKSLWSKADTTWNK